MSAMRVLQWTLCNLLYIKHDYEPDGWLPNGRTAYLCRHCGALYIGERGPHVARPRTLRS